MGALPGSSVVAFWMEPVETQSLPVPLQFGTTSGRPWLVDLAAAPWWVIGATILPASLGLVTKQLIQFEGSRGEIL